MIWHRKAPPSGLWLCGSASTWQWRAQNTSTLHATPPRTVPHVPPSNFPQLCGVQAVTERDSWIRRPYSGMRWYDDWLRFPGTGFRQSLLRSRRVQPPPDQGPFAFGPSYVLQLISPSDLLVLWRTVFTERQTRWQFELVKRCSGRPWCVRKTKLWHPSQHIHARSGLYRSLRYPILKRTAPVSARKHENLEDLFVSLLSLLEYISRTFSTRCSFVPGVARSQWSVVHGQCAGGKTSSD